MRPTRDKALNGGGAQASYDSATDTWSIAGGSATFDQVAHIAEHRVDIRLTNAEVAEQPEHEEGAPVYRSEAPVGRGRDLWRRLRLRGLWRKE